MQFLRQMEHFHLIDLIKGEIFFPPDNKSSSSNKFEFNPNIRKDNYRNDY